MKIAIIGAGFFGSYLAYKLKSSHSISVFDKNASIMQGSAKYNQNRLHMGFHYPRSLKTIQQTFSGYQQFIDEFKEYVTIPKENYYIIHHDSILNFKEYCQVFKDQKIPFKDAQIPQYLVNHSQFEGCIQVQEGIINLDLLRNFFQSQISDHIYYRSEVVNIDAKNGILEFANGPSQKFDYIINASYTQLNMGLPTDLQFQVKYELACMVYFKSIIKDYAFTIMDGPFASLYPGYDHFYTLSSVISTPFTIYENDVNLSNYLKTFPHSENIDLTLNKIIKDGKKYFDLEKFQLTNPKLWYAPKVKLLADQDAKRYSEIKSYAKLSAILCGKLDSVFDIYSQIRSVLSKS